MRLVPFGPARLHGPVELRDRHHRDAQLLGQRLQAARDLRDLLGAVLVARVGSRHELQIIDDEQVQAVLEAEAARLRAHLHDRDAGRVVDEHLGLRQRARRPAQPVPVLLVEVAGVDLVGVDLPLGAQQSFDELLLGHLEAEDPDALPLLERHVGRDVEANAGLAQAGSRGHDDQVRGMEPRGHPIELREAGLDPGDERLAVGDLLDRLVDRGHQRLDRLEAGPELPPGDLEDLLLDVFQDLLRRVLALVAARHDLVGDLDQAAQRRLLLHDLGVVLDVGRARQPVGQARHVGGPPDALELVGALEGVHERHEVDRAGVVHQVAHPPEDPPVALEIEVLRAHDLQRRVDRLVVEQDRAQDGALRLEVVRKGFLQAEVRRHGRKEREEGILHADALRV